MKLFVCLIFLLLDVQSLSRRVQILNGDLKKRHDQRFSQNDVQQCKRGSTCSVWYKCPPSRLPRHKIYPPCIYEGYSRWDMGVCCANSRGDPRVDDDVTNPITSTAITTMASPKNPKNSECGRSVSTPGSKIRPRSWPWVVAIKKAERNGTENFWCNGFLIDRSHVLTAGHCFKDKKQNMMVFTLRIGSIDQRLGDVYHIKKWVIPKDYRPGYFYSDIALVTLDRPVTSSDFMPICLPDPTFRDYIGRKLTFAGWTLKNLGGLPSDFLQERHGILIISTNRCESFYRKRTQFSSNKTFPLGLTTDFICASISHGSISYGRGNCRGYSGAPLMTYESGRWYAIGILAFGIQKCDTPGVPVGYTRVSSFTEFIKENL